MDAAELQRRKDLCAATLDRLGRVTPPSLRPPPRLRFVAKEKGHGRFTPRINEVKIGVAGVLDDPAMTDGMIEALVAHEMGHWADPDLDAAMFHSRIVCLPVLALGFLIPIGLAVRALATGDATNLVVYSVVALMVGIVGAHALSPFFEWRGEYFADRFAAESTSAEKVISLMKHFLAQGSRFSSHSHPSRARRIRRIERNAISASEQQTTAKGRGWPLPPQ
jgi:hypothetical protein